MFRDGDTALLDANILYSAPIRDLFLQFCESVRKVRARLKAPPLSVRDYLANLSKQELVATAAELGQFAPLL